MYCNLSEISIKFREGSYNYTISIHPKKTALIVFVWATYI